MTDSLLTRTFRAEVTSKVGKVAENLMPDREPTFADFQELYPDGPSYARALGLGDYSTHRRGTKAFRRRQNALDAYSRWRRGGRNPFGQGGHGDRLASLVRTAWRDTATPLTTKEVLNLVVDHGATVTRFSGAFSYDHGRERTVNSPVYIWPEVLDESAFSFAVSVSPPIGWEWLARAFLSAWARAYGLDDNFQAEITEGDDAGATTTDFAFEIGKAEVYLYDYPYMTGAM